MFSIHEVADSGDILSSDSSADLVELRESEFFGIGDDDRIGSEKIHPVFDHSRREKDIILSMLEFMNPILDHFRRKLTMDRYDTRSGDSVIASL